MNTQTVTPATARLLAAAGFPQPAPAPGQWWGDDDGVVFVFGETKPMPGIHWLDENGNIHPIVGHTPVVHYVADGRPIIDDYFDARDFRGLVYLPTVGDILRELPEDIVYWCNTVENDFGVGRVDYGEVSCKVSAHEHPAEAAALAYLELHLQKQV